MRGNLEKLFEYLLDIILAPEHVRGFKFHPTRKWRFDFAWPKLKIALEIARGFYQSEKYDRASRLGWRVLSVTARQVRDGSAIIWLKRLLGENDGETNLS